MEITVTEQILNRVGRIHGGALITLVDEVTSLLKLSIERTKLHFVSVYLGISQYVHEIPLGETITIQGRLVKPNITLYHSTCYKLQYVTPLSHL